MYYSFWLASKRRERKCRTGESNELFIYRLSTLEAQKESGVIDQEKMSRNSSGYKVFVGRIPSDARTRDLETFFKDYGFSKCIRDINMKSGFAFVVCITALIIADRSCFYL